MVAVVPVPGVVIPPGLRVTVQVPLDGSPLSATLPVETAQVGCVMVPITGAVGVAGCAFITTLPVEGEIQPEALVTVKVYVPAASPLMVVLDPEPVVVPPGVLVIVQFPDGNPLRTTLPVAREHVGCVTVPTTGAEGVALTASE